MNLYLKAARRIADGTHTFSCSAILNENPNDWFVTSKPAVDPELLDAKNAYESLFRPTSKDIPKDIPAYLNYGVAKGAPWGENWGLKNLSEDSKRWDTMWDIDYEEVENCRILALCFAAAVFDESA